MDRDHPSPMLGGSQALDGAIPITSAALVVQPATPRPAWLEPLDGAETEAADESRRAAYDAMFGGMADYLFNADAAEEEARREEEEKGRQAATHEAEAQPEMPAADAPAEDAPECTLETLAPARRWVAWQKEDR